MYKCASEKKIGSFGTPLLAHSEIQLKLVWLSLFSEVHDHIYIFD